MRYWSIVLTLIALIVLIPSVRAETLAEGEYGFCLTGPSEKFSDAMDGIAPDFVAHNNHWHFEGDLPEPGCYIGEAYLVQDERGNHAYIKPGYFAVNQDEAFKLVHYKFGYCDGDDQFCGKNNRNSRGSTNNMTKGRD